jgi:pyroglutamyl-peptidase
MGRIQMRVLVTGFGPFLSHDVNPSTDLALALGGRSEGGVELVALAPIPVAFGEAAEIVLREVARVGARGLVSLGLSARATTLRVERRAINRVTSVELDARGQSMLGEDIEPESLETLETSIDVEAFATVLRARGQGAETSTDAGGYVCNYLYYRALSACARTGVPARALFVHVPPSPPPGAADALAAAIAATFCD